MTASGSDRTYRIVIVDVFAEARLAGNQLAVVLDAAGITDDEMQRIALETNFSETTFVLEQSAGRAKVRIFTLKAELPFAGHPTVGTAWVLTGGEGHITLELKAGDVPVDFVDGVGWMRPPEVDFQGPMDAAAATSLVGLTPDDVAPDFPIERAEVGPKFVILPVKDLATLKRAQLNVDVYKSVLSADGTGVHALFLFSPEPYDDSADYASRMFFEAGGVREDPATGSANTAFAAYLRKYRGKLGDVVVDQGVEIDRPSRLYLKVADEILVGGKVQPVITGELTL